MDANFSLIEFLMPNVGLKIFTQCGGCINVVGVLPSSIAKRTNENDLNIQEFDKGRPSKCNDRPFSCKSRGLQWISYTIF